MSVLSQNVSRAEVDLPASVKGPFREDLRFSGCGWADLSHKGPKFLLKMHRTLIVDHTIYLASKYSDLSLKLCSSNLYIFDFSFQYSFFWYLRHTYVVCGEQDAKFDCVGHV